jgi:diguanylate cyclase (GGDEF)-like protein/PAS domain S-box-containing protein
LLRRIDVDDAGVTGLHTAGERSALDRLARWDEIVSDLATAVMVTDVAGRAVIWNRAATTLFGWADILGRPVLPLLLPMEVEVDAVAVLTAVATGVPWTGELDCNRRDRSRVSVFLTVTALHDDVGVLLGFVGEARDLSDLREADDRSRDTERLSRELLLHTTEPACVMTADGMFKYVVTSESSLGYFSSDLTGTCAFDLVHADDVEVVRDAYAEVAADASLHPTVVYRGRTKSGTWRWREVHLSNHIDDPILGGIVCNVADITEQQELLAELRAADARQRAIVARSRDVTLFFDIDGTIRWASPVSHEMLGIEPEDLVGQSGLDFVHPDDQERVFAEFLTIAGLGEHVRTEFRINHPRGGVRWMEEDATNLVDDPDVGYIVGNLRDITERRHAQEQLERLALHDALTGLPNRLVLVNRLEQLLARGSAAAVLFVDIDNFADVNDALGQETGDELLQMIGARFANEIKHSPATLARVGGDQFVLLCDEVGDAITALAYAERLRNTLTLPIRVEDQDIVVSVSIGVALSPGDAGSLMRDAGIAAQQAKQQGRDRVVMFDASLDVTQLRRMAVQSELRHALIHDELVVWYQPIVDLQTDEVTSVEALVRWNHPERGLLSPEQFIGIAESSGLIRAVGSQVLKRACADARAWHDTGHAVRISVNAAAAQLSSPDFVSEIETALNEFGLDPDQLTIEITETAAMQIADSLGNLKRIRALGVHLSLDDFGTGYSSLSFLRELPVDAIKIDRSFVSGLGTNARDTSIVQGVIAMAEALGYDVVAEGIETEVQAEALRLIGCRYAQGFLWSRPAPADAIRAISQRVEASLRQDQ